MSNIKAAPLMKIRRHDSNVVMSFDTTETIHATRAALREYMQRHHFGKPLSDTELDSVKFRHRTKRTKEVDGADDSIKNWWSAEWVVIYITDGDRRETDKASATLKIKMRYPGTVFGFCEQYPVA